MNGPIELEIITPGAPVLAARIRDLYIPAYYGEAGILSHHLPYVAILRAGELSYLDDTGQRRHFYLENGLFEVRDNRIVVMADAIEAGADMDPDELQRELQESEARIHSSFSGKITPEELAVELARQRTLQTKIAICRKGRPDSCGA